MDRNSGKSRGFAYVTFSTTEAVEKALAINGKEIDGRAVNIDKTEEKDRTQTRENRARAFGDTPSEASAVLFVGNLSFDATEDALWEAFSEYGDVKSVRMPTDRDTGRPKGFGYVEFADIDSSKKAFEGLAGAEIAGRAIRLDYSQPRDPNGGGRGGRGGFGGRGGYGGFGRGGFNGGYGGAGGPGFDPNAAPPAPNPFTDFATAGGEPSNIIYVRNLPWSTSNEDLVELFTTIGKVERAEIQYEPNGRSRGTGVVEFEKAADAETSIGMFPRVVTHSSTNMPAAKFTGYQYGGRPLGLAYVKYTNVGNGDAMEGTEHTSGLTQDQIM